MTRLLNTDEARLAVWKAIEAITIGNTTDDKLIVANLAKAGVYLATVAAANDEGVVCAPVDTSEYRTDYQIGKADGIEAAAKVADDLALVGILTPGWLDGASSAQRQIASAIRLLSQGEGKA